MALRNTDSSYGSIAKCFHWLIFTLVLIMIIVGFFMGDIPKPLRYEIYMLHKLCGLTILGLMVLRALWALSNPKPKLPEGTPSWERVVEIGMHFLLYAVLIAMPLTGWIMSTAAGHDPSFFHLFNIPFPGIVKDKALAKLFNGYHELLAWTIIVLVVMHVGAALWHHIVKKDNILERMRPCKK